MNELETIACITRVVLFSDERAFEQIVRAYEQPLRQFLLQQTDGNDDLTDDLAQETFIRAWQQLHSFRRASQFRTWLFSIAYHLYMDECRRRQAHPEVDIALLTAQSDIADEDSGENEDREQRERWVRNALNRIPEPARTCLSLFYMQDMSAVEVAKITGLTENNVRQIIFRNKTKLKEILITTQDENQ